MFLDEPTLGLDPGLERRLMFTLRKLADAGRTVVLITHATQNIRVCDHIVYLVDGKMVYFGPPAQALEFFGAPDFADIYAATDEPEKPEESAGACGPITNGLHGPREHVRRCTATPRSLARRYERPRSRA